MSKLLPTDCSLVSIHKNFGSLGILLLMFSVTIQFRFISNDRGEMQDLLPAAAFTALG